MSECLFCQIINGDIPSNIVYQDDTVLAFEDIHPQAPTHCLIIPKQHITTINDLQSDDAYLIGYMTLTAQKLAKDYKLANNGYRLVFNCNEQGGQSVFHIHLHLLGGRSMQWPPG